MVTAQSARSRFLLAVAGFGAALVASSPALAQAPTEKSIEIQLLQYAIGPRGFLTVDSGSVPAHKTFGVGLLFSYQRSPFAIYSITGDDELRRNFDVVRQQATAELTAAMGLYDRFQVGFALPVTLMLDGRNFTSTGQAANEKLSGGGIGDLRLEAKGLLSHIRYGGDEEGDEAGDNGEVFFSAAAGVTLPTGNEDKFLGDKNVTGRARVIGEYRNGRFRSGAYLGALFRQETRVFAADVGHQVMYGGALEYSLHRQVGVLTEIFGRNGFNRYTDANPLELLAAMRVNVTSMFSIIAGGGVGLIQGIGAPKARGFLGANFNPDFRDADNDGVYDIDDRCAGELEDLDGFKDRDGCPDPDNDGDGLLDTEDKCATDPEDLDQFQDEDGCPEGDNDNDGISDIKDPCPNAAEDGQGKRPKDGCPSSAEDSDGDGVVDAKDQCADEPEDRDGFQDYDGCADVDNDDDGIPDQFDTCPGEAEDADGYQDEDGCPEPDNDKDGIPDARDQCPQEPESLNGNKDDDGCPDPGAAVVQLGEEEIELRERVAFKGNALAAPGQAIVKLVGMVLKGHPELTVVRVESVGANEAEAKARGEAVKSALTTAGVAEKRLKVASSTGRPGVRFVIESKAPPAGAKAGGAE